MLNRDSMILKVIPLLSMMTAVIVATITNPAEWGLSAISIKWIGLLSTLLGTVSAWLGTSGLPGKNDIERIKTDHRSHSFLLPLLLAGSMLATGCTMISKLEDPSVKGPTQEEIDKIQQEHVQRVRRRAVSIAAAVESGGEFVVQARRATGAAYDARLISLEQRDAIYQAIIDLEPRAHAVIDVAATVTSDLSLRSIVKAYNGVIEDLLIKLGTGSPAMASVATALRTTLAAVFTYLGGAQ